MKLKQVLEIQEVLGKTIPIDMNHKWMYYSDSREEWVDIMELDIIHAIRILRKYIGQDEYYDEKRTAMYYDNDGINI
tara:strand:- start:226 stop:456 length:231 start_codon:yes stop_codon:yes gene_type:complete